MDNLEKPNTRVLQLPLVIKYAKNKYTLHKYAAHKYVVRSSAKFPFFSK